MAREEHSNDQQLQHAVTLAALCRKVSQELALRAESDALIKKLIAGFNTLVGLASFLMLSVPEVGNYIGRDIAHFVSVVGIVVLVATPYLIQGLFRDPPERLQDYAFYIGSFSDRITEYAAITGSDGSRHLTEVVHWAGVNLTDARTKFPKIIARAERALTR